MRKTATKLILIIILNLFTVNNLCAQNTNRHYEFKIDSTKLILGNIIIIEIYTESNDIEVELPKSKAFKFIGVKTDSTQLTSKITNISNTPNSNRYIKIAQFEIKEAGELNFPSIKIITPTVTFKTEEQKIRVMTIEDYKNKNNSFPFINNEEHPEIKKGILSEFVLTKNKSYNPKDTLFGSIRIYTRFSNPIIPYGIEKSKNEWDIIPINKKGISNGLVKKNGKLYQCYDIYFLKIASHNKKNESFKNFNLKSIIKVPFEKSKGLLATIYRNYIIQKIITTELTE